MDEPLSNLDALLRLEMRAELKGVLAESKTTAIYVTHDQVEAMSLADRISVMNQGRIVQASHPVDIYRNPAEKFVAGFIGNPPMNFLVADKQADGRWNVAGQAYDGPSCAENTLDFAIRPEDLALAETGIQAKVNVIEPLGAHLLVTCDVNGAQFRATLDSDAKIGRGDTIALQPNLHRIRWFDPSNGMRKSLEKNDV
jgi:multiple sugar transport system ATP-binding protein